MSLLDKTTDRELEEYLFTLDGIIERLSNEVERLRTRLRETEERIGLAPDRIIET
jgi:hypothetical protein